MVTCFQSDERVLPLEKAVGVTTPPSERLSEEGLTTRRNMRTSLCLLHCILICHNLPLLERLHSPVTDRAAENPLSARSDLTTEQAVRVPASLGRGKSGGGHGISVTVVERVHALELAGVLNDLPSSTDDESEESPPFPWHGRRRCNPRLGAVKSPSIIPGPQGAKLDRGVAHRLVDVVLSGALDAFHDSCSLEHAAYHARGEDSMAAEVGRVMEWLRSERGGRAVAQEVAEFGLAGHVNERRAFTSFSVSWGAQVLVFLRVGTPSKDGAPVARMAIGYAHEMEENAATEVYTLLAVESAQRPVHVWGPAKRIVGAKQAKRSSWFHVIPVHWILGTVIVTATQSDGHGRGVAPATLSGAR